MQSLFNQAAANLKDGLTMALLHLVLKHFDLRSLKHELRVQLFKNFPEVVDLNGLSELLAALDEGLCLLFLSKTILKLNEVGQTAQKASDRVHDYLHLKVVDPRLKCHHLSDWSLEIQIGAYG